MKHLKLLAAAGLVILTAVSCKKTTYEPPPAISAISFYNASPDAPAVSIYLNANKIQYDSLSYKGGIEYVNAYSGNREVSAYRNNEKKVYKNITLDQGKFYSAFLTGNWSTAEFVLLEDSLIRPAAGKANIRFVNMSIGSPTLDLALNTGTTLVSGRAYKANSAYTPIDGEKQYTFVIREHGTTVNKVTLPSVNLLSGHSYTIWARGIYAATDATALGAEIVRNY
ncbi:DUF4397 domain-containing protein [Mucilaginibacter sp. UR6-11]|uniref:DUF4397 domain-containing protein n=1 Tax=Mucilaginibacter sp. UR6-11 TaxID=1435644 RepID=UPI001E2E57A8|nr:DUF4397 domain-containing protein [Mucilaginibacter sp. UR6-11]MCC8423867.1 DUF4397 domain-containing protein [Mucilaginibacter sp. UR6-11]